MRKRVWWAHGLPLAVAIHFSRTRASKCHGWFGYSPDFQPPNQRPLCHVPGFLMKCLMGVSTPLDMYGMIDLPGTMCLPETYGAPENRDSTSHVRIQQPIT
jgi:hypothetical protein